jgi:hypothetical protein
VTKDELEQWDREYHAAGHAIQSAIALRIQRTGENAAGADGKHLRTGLDMGKADHAALVDLLISKGIFTQDEYLDKVLHWTKVEADFQAKTTRERCGLPDNVTFG